MRGVFFIHIFLTIFTIRYLFDITINMGVAKAYIVNIYIIKKVRKIYFHIL